MLNESTVQGRFTTTPELRTTNNGKEVTNFSLAVERDYKSEDGDRRTDFINVTAWGHNAVFVTRYFEKGDMAIVSGRIQTQKYDDKNGISRVETYIIAEHIYFCGRRSRPEEVQPKHDFDDIDDGGVYDDGKGY